MPTGLLIHADSERDADMFVATGISCPDPFTYIETGSRRIIVTNVLEAEMVRRDSTANEVWLEDDLGRRELVRDGMNPHAATHETVRRALERAGLDRVSVPPTFPIALADYLRSQTLHVLADRDAFELRRRRKTPAQLAGIRIAQRATEVAYAAARELIGSASPGDGGVLMAGREPLTCERVRDEIVAVLRAQGCETPPPIVASGPAASNVHDLGSGPIRAHEGIIIDVFPRHSASRFCADMTRTFCFGEPPERLRAIHVVVLDALKRSTEAIAAGVSGDRPWNVACDVIEGAGYRTQRNAPPGAPLDEDFFHGLGHGVGFDVHEAPYMSMGGSSELLAGDVVTNEPGVYRKDLGGVRLEDLLLVTDGGHELLTDFDYELQIG